MHFLSETQDAITESGHTPADICFIGSRTSGHQCTWEEFMVLANHDYHRGFGAPQVAIDLLIVFTDGHQLWRGECEGSERWEHCAPFVAPTERKPITHLFAQGVGWKTLQVIHEGHE